MFYLYILFDILTELTFNHIKSRGLELIFCLTYPDEAISLLKNKKEIKKKTYVSVLKSLIISQFKFSLQYILRIKFFNK